MKISPKFFIIFTVLFCSASAQELNGPEIIQRVNDLLNQETCKATMKMTIQTTSGQLRTFVYESYSKNKGEKNLMIYQSPVRVKDQAILMLNNADDIWSYFPKTGRIRKLATHAKRQKLEGSDFTYEDMGAGETFITDFDAVLIGEEKKEKHNCYKVDMIRKKQAASSYSRIMIWVDKQTFVPIVINYYDDDDPNRLLKQMIQSDIREIDGVPTAMKAVMTNQEDLTETVIEFTEIQYNIPLDDDLFTERGMKK